jgi:hypothetical protein
MEACYGGTDVMERSCAVARGIDINMTVQMYRVELNALYCIILYCTRTLYYINRKWRA